MYSIRGKYIDQLGGPSGAPFAGLVVDCCCQDPRRNQRADERRRRASAAMKRKTAVADLANQPIRVGIFATVPAAERAVHDLLTAGFTAEQITVVCSDPQKERSFEQYHHEDPAGTTTPAKAIAGGAIGAALGGLTILAGAAATGGTALLAAGGAVAWTGGVLGGLIGAMISRGVERELANFYDQEVQRGNLLVAVEDQSAEARERLGEAEQILAEAGAEPFPLGER